MDKPAKILGILGGGQLGRMSALAAARLGIKCVIYTTGKDEPASQVAWKTITAPYDDKNALDEFAHLCDVITYEFENIPVEAVSYLKSKTPVYPDSKLLEVSQDRIAEKTFLNSIDIPTTRWKKIEDADDIQACFKEWDCETIILKTTRFGYDGKGQSKVSIEDNIEDILSSFEGQSLIAEEIVRFKHEISVIIARDKNGKSETYGPAHNIHENHILATSTCPAPISSPLKVRAAVITEKLATEVDLRGVLALEMFVTEDGQILANEIAPRTHNSGHWTIDACSVSQFENHVRTVCGLPVGLPIQHSNAKMVNLIGNDIEKISEYLLDYKACVHDYGKAETHEGRKMGHVTLLSRQRDAG